MSIFRCNACCNKLKFVFTQKQPLESRLLILVHLIVGNEPYKDSEVAEATASSVSIYPG